MGFSRQEYCGGLLGLSPGDLPDPGIEITSLMSSASAGEFCMHQINLLKDKLLFFLVPLPWLSHEEFHPLPVCYQRISMTPCRLECREEAGRSYRIDSSFARPASPRWLLLEVVLFHCLVFILFFWLCHMACGILGPSPGIKHVPSALEAHNLNYGTPREVSRWWFLSPPLCFTETPTYASTRERSSVLCGH